METWKAETASTKAVTELLQTTMGNNDFVCTREMRQASIRVRDDLLVPVAQKLGAERGHRIWTTCIEGVQEITLCFQEIQATSRHQALALLKEAEVDATDGEWERATCTIRRRRGARPPLAAVTVKVQPNASLYRLLIDQQRIKQDTVEVWVCRDEEQLGSVTTLVPDPVLEGHCLRSWTNVYDMLGISEALQRELILLAVMLEQLEVYAAMQHFGQRRKRHSGCSAGTSTLCVSLPAPISTFSVCECVSDEFEAPRLSSDDERNDVPSTEERRGAEASRLSSV
jgi:hypothetical protein